MANFEYNFNENELSLIQSSSWDEELGHQEVNLPYYFNELKGDYLRVTIFDEDDNFITKFDSNDKEVTSQLAAQNLHFIYRDKTPESISDVGGQVTTGKIFIKANELLKLANLTEGKYTLRVDFLRNVFSSIFTEPENYIVNSNFLISEQDSNEGGYGYYSFDPYSGDVDDFNDVIASGDYNWSTESESPHGTEFRIYKHKRFYQLLIDGTGNPEQALNHPARLQPGIPYLYSADYRVGDFYGAPDSGSWSYENSKVSYNRASWPFTPFQNTTENTTPNNTVNLKDTFLDSTNLNSSRKVNLKFIANNTEHFFTKIGVSPAAELLYSLSEGVIASYLEDNHKIFNPQAPQISQPGKRVFVYNEAWAIANGLNQYQHLGANSHANDLFLARTAVDGDVILGPDETNIYFPTPTLDPGKIVTFDNTGGPFRESNYPIFTNSPNEPEYLADPADEFGVYITNIQIQKGWNDEGYVETSTDSFVPSGNTDDLNAELKNPKFVVKEISNSRKEVRLIIRNDADDLHFNPDFISKWESVLGTLNEENYGFDFVLNYGQSKSLPITNYTFDSLSEENADKLTGELVSIILRLNQPLDSTVNIWDEVFIEKELITTHLQKVYYFADELKQRGQGALEIDEEFPFNQSEATDTAVLENYVELFDSSSLETNTVSHLLTGSKDIDNINVNWNSFSNHTTYGSAYQKVYNFYQKVSTLETYYNELSSSLLFTEDSTWNVKDELVTNGNFTASADGWGNHPTKEYDSLGWNESRQALAFVGDGIDDDGDTTNIACSDDNISLVAGRKYRYTFKLTLQAGATPNLSINASCGGTLRHNLTVTNATGTTLNQGTFYATHTENVVIEVRNAADASTEFFLDDVSIAEIAAEKNNSQVVQRRNELFEKISDITNNFTPYEKFLYYDGQSESTASAPNVKPVTILGSPFNVNTGSANNSDGTSVQPYVEELYNINGFNIMYKVSDVNLKNLAAGATKIPMFNNRYRVQDKPFFNYSGPLYLSFLQKGDEEFDWVTSLQDRQENPRIPDDAIHQKVTESFYTTITGSKWTRGIIVASQSHWRPSQSLGVGAAGDSGIAVSNYNAGSTQVEVLPSGSATGSYPIQVYGDYTQLASDYVESGTTFTGSILPSGHIFGLHANTGSNINVTSSYFTDIKITRNNPQESLPFSIQYRTGSTVFNNWWTAASASAAAYDNDNIHSIFKTLPLLYQDDLNNEVLYKFVSMMGEFFDTQKNLIDTFGTLKERDYNKYNSPPTSYITDIASSLGWDLISPFSSSLSSYFGNQNELFVDANNVSDVERNTYLKIINNLMYLYKTKGTANAYRALMNIYGYPADVLKIQELGTSMTPHNPEIINNEIENLLDGLKVREGNIGFIEDRKELPTYIFNHSGSSATNHNKFSLDWWRNGATIESFEFVFKPYQSSNTQTLVSSISGSSNDYWQLNLEPSASDSSRGRLSLVLNNSSNGTSAIASNQVSCSTDYLKLKDNNLWNIKINRTIATASNLATQSYQIFLGKQDNDKIKHFTTASLINSNSVVNHNFTASFVSGSHSNLQIGKTFTGSIGEIKGWKENLNTSKFKQHILNKFSTVGNHSSSSRTELVYHFKLNEGYKEHIHAASSSLRFADSNPNTITDYSFTKAGSSLFFSSSLFDSDNINTYKFSLRSTGYDNKNDNKIISNPVQNIVKPLNPNESSNASLSDSTTTEATRTNSNVIQIVRSPQTVLNDYLVNLMADNDITNLFGNPSDLYKDEYPELKLLHKQVFDDMGVVLNVNKWLDAQEGIFSEALENNIRKILPARTTLSEIGVLFEPTMLERSKIKNPTLSHELIGISGSVDKIQYYSFKESKKVISPETTINSIEKMVLTGTDEAAKETKTPISLTQETFTLNAQKELLNTNPTPLSIIDHYSFTDSVKESSKNGTISYRNIVTTTARADADNILKTITSPRKIATTDNSKIDVHSTYTINSNTDNAIEGDALRLVDSASTVAAEFKPIYTGSYDYTGNITSAAEYLASLDVTLNEFNTLALRTPDDLSKKWGRTIDDVHFVTMVPGTSSVDSFNNVDYYENQIVFQMVGDYEVISASRYENGTAYIDWENQSFFLNRQLVIHGPKKGREIGKTSWTPTASNGQIEYPSNHISRNPDPFHQRMIDGNQHVGSKFYNVPDKDDLSTSSFYRIKVTGENKLIVRKNKRITDDDGNVSDIR